MRTFFAWWEGEISTLLPSWLRFSLFGTVTVQKIRFADNLTNYSQDTDTIIFPLDVLSTNAHFNPKKFSRSTIVDIELPASVCLERSLDVPELPSSKMVQAIALNTQHNTPFKLNDVVWTYHRENSNQISQFIYRVTDADNLIHKLKAIGVQVRKLSVEDCDGPAMLDNGLSIVQPYRFWRRLNFVLLFVVLSMILALLWMPLVSQREYLVSLKEERDQIQSATFELREKLSNLKEIESENDDFINALSNRYLLADVLKELTIILPDEAWVSYVEFQNQSVTISGSVAGSAAELVLLIGKSKTLNDPHLSGPVSQGQNTGTENFEISATLARRDQ